MRTWPAAVALVLLTACSATPPAPPSSRAAPTTPAPTPTPTTSSPTLPTPGTTAPPASTPATTSPASPPPTTATPGPVVVIDPGHSPAVSGTDPATGLDVSTYENEPEMRDVWAVSLLVRDRLVADGYTVYLTKDTVDARVDLGQRAALADSVHAVIAVSVHDQAGANGGIPFASGNNLVYYQRVGAYRQRPDGSKVVFTDAALAATSQRYAQVFQTQRAAAEGHPVTLMGDTGSDQGGRGHPGGNMWMVQLLSHVPWVYDEAGGNSAGTVGLTPADEQRYADGLVRSIEACVPV